jgi:hypothetical protein
MGTLSPANLQMTRSAYASWPLGWARSESSADAERALLFMMRAFYLVVAAGPTSVPRLAPVTVPKSPGNQTRVPARQRSGCVVGSAAPSRRVHDVPRDTTSSPHDPFRACLVPGTWSRQDGSTYIGLGHGVEAHARSLSALLIASCPRLILESPFAPVQGTLISRRRFLAERSGLRLRTSRRPAPVRGPLVSLYRFFG